MFETIFTKNQLRIVLKHLAQDRKALITGNLTDMAERGAKYEVLANGLIDRLDNLNHSELQVVRNEAARNMQLLEAALVGVQTARDMISKHRISAKKTGTYTGSGERIELSRPSEANDRTV